MAEKYTEGSRQNTKHSLYPSKFLSAAPCFWLPDNRKGTSNDALEQLMFFFNKKT